MKLLVRFLLSATLIAVGADANTNFVLTRFEHCDSNGNYSFKFNATFWTAKNVQYMNALAIFLRPFDNSLSLLIYINKRQTTGNGFVNMFTIKEKRACNSVHNNLGEFIYDVERAAGLIKGMCPVSKGRYTVRNLPLKFDRITLQTFPFGQLRFIIIVQNEKQNRNLTCLISDVENRSIE